MTRRIVVATESTTLAGGGELLLRLVRWLQRSGVDVEVLALADGPDRERFAATAPTTVLRNLPGAGLELIASMGGTRLTQGLRGWRLRRWLGARRGASFLVHHPRSASVLRYAPGAPRVVAMLPEASWQLDDLREVDTATLGKLASGWLVHTDAQVSEVEHHTGSPAMVVGPLLHAEDLPAVEQDEAKGAVVLVTADDGWSSVDHAVEAAVALAGLLPDREVRWVVHSEESRWLAAHDVQHARLGGAVRLVHDTSADVLRDVSVVVRTSYEPSSSPLVVAARLAGVPVVAFNSDASPALPVMAPFDVEALVDLTVELSRRGSARRRDVTPGAGFEPEPARVVDAVLAWLDAPRPERVTGS